MDIDNSYEHYEPIVKKYKSGQQLIKDKLKELRFVLHKVHQYHEIDIRYTGWNTGNNAFRNILKQKYTLYEKIVKKISKVGFKISVFFLIFCVYMYFSYEASISVVQQKQQQMEKITEIKGDSGQLNQKVQDKDYITYKKEQIKNAFEQQGNFKIKDLKYQIH
ncbi:hypothetical protein PPERSA_11574 [Pseudocohnilembus persalinus]|uniref:Uncharacterized protein n=1 Tax=Pseudocohnilembus persalinus TaxID=266149 RepID=A0A0V0Q9Q5_PSEPJ|nr:hypothetical protein PPERSA_11574 [Pseudocohnilembus persalinus]|eukprot:KRW98973.1 hypothetical protein PPERSA_11574 [Pseudocohnilembus persalinus]